MFYSAARALAQEAAAYRSRTIPYIIGYKPGAYMIAEGAGFVGDTPDQYTALIQSELAKRGKAVKASGAKVD